tara:strand:+ start:740 stop:2176 length:1437 start_codon:yes stop_codon:yes gene_type:complete
MGLLENTQRDYYEGTEFGNYQFTSLKDIINQFMVVYVGEDKLIEKARKMDVQFHAMRAMQELSFDTFKSTKSQEIVVPTSLNMILPHDYVNYIKLTWSDSAGIEHIIYPTLKTSNPFKIKQEADGAYDFAEDQELVVDANFDEPYLKAPWVKNSLSTAMKNAGYAIKTNTPTSNALNFTHVSQSLNGSFTGRTFAAWQEINVKDIDYVNISATGTSSQAAGQIPAGLLRFGISSVPGDKKTNPNHPINPSTNGNAPDIAFLEWNDSTAGTATELELNDIDVRSYDKVYVLVTSTIAFVNAAGGTAVTNVIDNLSVKNSFDPSNLQPEKESTTWANYKANTPTENINRYDDGTFDLIQSERYGIDPLFANSNGSFYIDDNKGLIHFSSNISGKTLVLKYISDGLGTEEEMQVHKMAEEAMYACIAYAIMCGKKNVPEYIVNRLKRQKFASVRKAKLRLSNIKLEELTQALRGKSKQIKH